MMNATAAMQAAALLGVGYADAASALASFELPARRLELRGKPDDVAVYLDFAHHPTAIRETLSAIRSLGANRILAAVELRSNTMRAGVHGAQVPEAISQADMSWVLGGAANDDACKNYGVTPISNPESLVTEIAKQARPGDIVVLMSNGDLSGAADAIVSALTPG